jgi:hypothetical protein
MASVHLAQPTKVPRSMLNLRGGGSSFAPVNPVALLRSGTVLRTLDRRHWPRPIVGNEVSSAGASKQRIQNRPADGRFLGSASLSCRRSGLLNTEAGSWPRLESWMPLEVVQARTALRSTAQLVFRLVERFPPTLRALLM